MNRFNSEPRRAGPVPSAASLRRIYARLLGRFGPAGWWPGETPLYAAGLPLFVVDAYTRRVFARLGLVRGDEPYDTLQRFFMQRLPPRAELYNDFHAQIVTLAKKFCRARPICTRCPLVAVCARRGLPRGLA